MKKVVALTLLAASFAAPVQAEDTSLEVGTFTMFSQTGASLTGAKTFGDKLTVRLQAADWLSYYGRAQVEYKLGESLYVIGGYRSQKIYDLTESGALAGIGYRYNFSDQTTLNASYTAENVYGGINALTLQYTYDFTYDWSFNVRYQVNSEISNETTVGIRYSF